MTDKKIILIALGVAIAPLMAYVICFWGIDISDNTTDWGAFGSYAAICVSSLSIALIYVTYREQRRTNEITRVEQHIVTMTNTLAVLSEKYNKRLEVSYCKFSEHFKLPFYDISDWEYDKTIKICKYYYSSITINDDYNGNINYFFRYLQLCIDYILNEKSLSTENKYLRITEFGFIFPESIRIMLFCWLLINNQTSLKDYYNSGIFILDETGPSLLEDVITYVCTKKCPPQRQIPEIDPNDIILEDYPNEQFHDTYNRLFNND
ncbi:MAG: hypothetical protein J6X88_10235 [Bacteroidales bacterium]|nr:hypothetical protein [Bacteroidales bacterium]